MKRLLKPLGIGIFIGVILAAAGKIFNIDKSVLQNVVFLSAAAIVAAALLYNMLATRPVRKKVKEQIALLDEGKPEEALKSMKELYTELVSRKMYKNANIVKLNYTAAYCDMERYEEALTVLDELQGEKLGGSADFVYSLNRCACLFYLNRDDEALKIYSDNEKLFKSYEKNKIYGENVEIINIFVLIANKNYEEAKIRLDKIKSGCSKRIQQDCRLLEEKLENLI